MDHSITIEDSKPCISKVHIGLRNVNHEAYKPVVVSIGPYHKAKSNLRAMQRKKNLYLKSLLERRNKSLEQRNKSQESREIYLEKLKKFDTEARKCYVEPMNSTIDEFAEMMLLDGCFIVELFRKIDKDVKVEFDEDDPIFRVKWMQNQILSDLMLLENQLPYFVLSEVHNMTKSEEEISLEEMVMSCFNFMLPRPHLKSKNAFENKTFNHLLHLIHVSCRPFPEKTIKNNEASNSGSAKNRGIEWSSDDETLCPLLPQNNNSGSDKNYEMKNHMGTLVELQEAGIKFEKVGKIYNGAFKKEEEKDDDYVSLFCINFESGVMTVPCFKVDGGTENLFRNLIAYEQHFPNVHPKYFTDFASLMNQLINSKEDAKVLRFKEIIINFLGCDDDLAQLFNRLTADVCESHEPYYLEVRQKVHKHCKTNYHILMAKLRRDYFKNPWAGVSTVAAAVLILLTVGQFVIALLTLLA